MVAEGRPCPLCEASLAAVRLPQLAGDEAPLRLTLLGMPALACPRRHTYFAKPDFALWLMEEVLERASATLPAGEASGWLFKRHACGGCAAPLAAGGGTREDFRLEAAYPGLAPFGVTLAMPVHRCGACGKAQVRSRAELRKLIPPALVHAFKAGAIKAPG